VELWENEKLLNLHHVSGSKCDQAVNTKGHETEGKYVETALIQLTKINDQFIFYSPMVVYNFFYNVYILLSKENQALLLDLKYHDMKAILLYAIGHRN